MKQETKTRKKTDEHTGFRNGDLFCFNCGTSQKMPLPMPVELAADFIKLFAKHHRTCKKTWREPANQIGNQLPEKENAVWWLANGEQGISSKTMFKYLVDDIPMENIREHHPLDPSDFRRCYLLLKAVPQLRDKLGRMKAVSVAWSNLVDNWDKLTEMLEEQIITHQDNGMYKFMKSLGC